MPIVRILTAFVLIFIIATGVLLLPTHWVAVLIGFISILGMVEWLKLAGFNNYKAQTTGLSVFVGAMLLIAWSFAHSHLPVMLVLTFTVLWWSVSAWRLYRIKDITVHQTPDFVVAIEGIFVLLTTWASLIWLHLQPHGPWLLLFLFILIWIADSGAYFAGRRWGKTQMSPLISPSKTWEGVYGALVGTVLWGLVLVWLYGSGITNRIMLLLLCLVTVAASILGDLYESLLKRKRCIKDSGDLLPGHGGMLDRIDSMTAAAPVFVCGLALVEMIA